VTGFVSKGIDSAQKFKGQKVELQVTITALDRLMGERTKGCYETEK